MMKFSGIGFLVLVCYWIVALSGVAEIDPAKAEAVWLFSDGAGRKVVGSSNHKRDGTLFGKGKWVKGKFGGGLELNGT